jgi:endonuclease/exonuclease/phosphatase family metal-dependent hydrolase
MNVTVLLRIAAVFLAVMVKTQCGAAELRILTYNIHHGRGTDDNLDLARIADIINSAKPDLVALNEVDKGVERSGRLDEPAELARLTGLESVFERNIDHEGGQYGNAVLSRHKILEHENVALPSYYDGEQRGMLMVRVQSASGERFWFAATHLDYRPDDAERFASAQMIEKLVGERFPDERFILAGDLNATPDSRVVERFAQTWTFGKSGPTFPASDPRKQIDYVLWRPAAAWRLVSTEVLDAPTASDHRPVLVVLELAD